MVGNDLNSIVILVLILFYLSKFPIRPETPAERTATHAKSIGRQNKGSTLLTRWGAVCEPLREKV